MCYNESTKHIGPENREGGYWIMADESTTNRYKFKYAERKDDELSLREYHAMAIYVYMFNEIRNNMSKYGFTSTTVDVAIDDYIYNNFDTLATNLGFDNNLTSDERTKCFHDRSGFNKLVNQAVQHATEKASADKVNDFNNFNSRPTNTDMHEILMQKRDATDKPYKDIKASTKIKDYQYKSDDKGGIKDGSGVIHAQLESANNNRIAMIRNKRKSFGKMLFRMLRLAVSAAITVASVAIALPAGAAALTGFFSVGASVAGKLGVAVVGALGAYFGGSRSLTNVLEVGACFKDWRRDVNKYKDFMAGRGAFAPENMTKKGFRDIQKEQLIQESLLIWMKKGEFKGKDKEFLKYFKMAQKRGTIKGLGGDEYLNKLRTEHDYVANEKNKFGFVPILDKLNAGAPKASVSTDNQYGDVENNLKNLKNYTEIVDPSTGLTRERDLKELVSSYELLNSYGEVFKGRIEANQNYKGALDKLDVILMNKIQEEIFNKPYSNASVDNINKLVETPIIQERLTKSTKFPDFTKKVKDYIDFINFENDSTKNSSVHRIREDLDVGFVGQTSLKKADIKDVLKTFGTDSDSVVTTALNDITTKTTRADVNAIDLSTITDSKTRAYLESVKNKRLSTIALNVADITTGMPTVPDADPDKATKDAEIASVIAKINNITENEAIKISAESLSPGVVKNKITTIRAEIANASFGDDIKEHLEKKLFEQFEALETKHRYDIKPQVVEKIKSGAIPNIKDIMEKINKIEVTEPKDGEKSPIDKLYEDSIKSINNSPEVKDYLTARLGEKIEEDIKLQIVGMAPNAAVTKMNEMVSVLKKITHCKYLTQLQKERLTKLFEDNVLEKATNIQMSKYEKLYAGLSEDDVKIIENLEKDYSKGGFKEYIQMGTAYGEALAKRIDRLQINFKQNKDLFVMSGGNVAFSNYKEKEIMAMSKLFFNRPLDASGNNSMVKVEGELKGIKNKQSNLGDSKNFITDSTFDIDLTPGSFKGSKFIEDIMNKVNNIKADADYSLNDKMLCLIEVKRLLMLTIKEHAYRFVVARRKGRESFKDSYDSDVSIRDDWSNIQMQWQKVATEIDGDIATILNDLRTKATSTPSDPISKKAFEACTKDYTPISLGDFINEFNANNIISMYESKESRSDKVMGS